MQTRSDFEVALDKCGADLMKLQRLFGQLQGLDQEWCDMARLQIVNRKHKARTALPTSDGRPLYAYNLQREQFEHWQETLSTQVESSTPHAGAFVLWAAEWFRRCYQGGILKWEALGEPIGLRLSHHAQWADLADRGLRYWGLSPVHLNGSNYRLVAIARQAGFPIAALADGQSGWAKEYLSGLVGQLLGAAAIREDTAMIIAKNLSSRIPATWYNQQMQAVCAELASVIVKLRQEAEAGGAGTAAVSLWLTQNHPDWRDELPLRVEGQASALIDTLLATKAIPGGGRSVRVRRFIEIKEGTVRDRLKFDLDGNLTLLPEHLAAVEADGGIARLRMFAADELAQTVTGELASAKAPDNIDESWPTRFTHRMNAHNYPLAKPVDVELRVDGQQIGSPFKLLGGEPVREGFRIYEPDKKAGDGQGKLWRRSWSSGAFKADTLIVELPDGWSYLADAAQETEVNSIWRQLTDRTFWQVRGKFIAENPVGDRYLVRPGQDAVQRDRLLLSGDRTAEGVSNLEGLLMILGQPVVRPMRGAGLAASGSERMIGWRKAGEREWQPLSAPAPVGLIEYGWRDCSTGHLRAKTSVILLPEEFAIKQQKNSNMLTLEIKGWSGKISLPDASATGSNKWRVNLAKYKRVRLPLTLTVDDADDIELEIPLPIVSWIANWDGKLLDPNSVISLTNLNHYVARNVGFDLMGVVRNAQAGSGERSERIWRGTSNMGLSSIRDDIARMIRPLGIDAQVQLDFNDSYSNHWYVQEFETEIEWRDGRGWFPVSSCGEDNIAVRGRRMADPAHEKTFGDYTVTDMIQGSPIPIPPLKEPWLIYLATDDRILSRPRMIGAAAVNPQAHMRLGKAMALPSAEARDALRKFASTILADPSTKEARDNMRSVIKLAHSLGGLPPKTFYIFDLLTEKPDLGPHLLMHADDKELASIIALSDGLLFDWAMVPIESWDKAKNDAGQYYMNCLAEMPGQSPEDRGTMVISFLDRQRAAILDALPWLANVFAPNAADDDSYDSMCERLFSRSGDRIDKDRVNPFRPLLDAHLTDCRLSPGFARISDAPAAAALAARRRLELTQAQIMAIKDVREHHPQFFGEAYDLALGEYT